MPGPQQLPFRKAFMKNWFAIEVSFGCISSRRRKLKSCSIGNSDVSYPIRQFNHVKNPNCAAMLSLGVLLLERPGFWDVSLWDLVVRYLTFSNSHFSIFS